MSQLILVRGVRQLLTLHGPAGPRRGAALRDLGIIRDGALLIRDGAILDIGPSRRIENLSAARHAEEIDADGRVVMPGFVDSHMHLPFSLPWLEEYEEQIGASPGAAAGDAGSGLHSTRHAIRALAPRRLGLQVGDFFGKLARHGTTTVECKSGWGPDEASELKYLRVVAAADGKPLDVAPSLLAGRVIPSEFGGDCRAYLNSTCSLFLPKVRRLKLARFADVDCCGVLAPEDVRRYYEAARQAGLLLKAHLGPAGLSTAIRLAVEYQAVSADHPDEASGDDLGVLARSSTVATLLPAQSFCTAASRYAPARALIEQGAAIALASGFHPGHCPVYSMQTVVALACSRLRMTPAEAIAAATINGAHALRMANRVGSLEPGKQADLLICNASDYREIPYYLGANSVSMTIKRGVVLYRGGRAPA
jgi:imidazolonepropionase